MNAHVDSRKWVVGLFATIVGAAGCMMQSEPLTENSQSSVSVGGKTVWLNASDYGWTGDDEVEDVVRITRDDSSWGGFSDGTQVSIAGSRYAFPEWTRSTGTVGLIELEADTGFWRGISTNLAIALFHRSAGSRNRWTPVDCGILSAGDRLRRTDLEYYEPEGLLIDLDYAEISARAPGSNDDEWVSFYDCGITESQPEFAAFVFPQYNWGNMEDEYAYTLRAWCDGDTCPAYTGTARDSGSRDSRYDSDSRLDCRDPRAGADCINTRDDRYYDDDDDDYDDRYDDDRRDSDRYDWSASSRGTLEVRDDGVACASITVNDDGDARDVVLTLEGRHDYPQALRITLGHLRRVVEVDLDDLPESGRFDVDDLEVYGFTGEAEGTWKLCVEDTDTRHRDDGEITFWSIGGR